MFLPSIWGLWSNWLVAAAPAEWYIIPPWNFMPFLSEVLDNIFAL